MEGRTDLGNWRVEWELRKINQIPSNISKEEETQGSLQEHSATL